MTASTRLSLVVVTLGALVTFGVGATATVAGAGRAAPEVPRADSANTLVKRTAAYVADLEAKLAYGVFDETYTQSVQRPLSDDHRTMTGELFLTHLPADDAWISVHDIATIDGEAVADRQDLVTLLQRGSLQSIRRAVADHNAQYNIGDIQRNFNEPTLALLVVTPAHIDDFTFSIEEIRNDTGTALTTLRFEERGDVARTLVTDRNDRRLRAKGNFVIEPATGRIHQTRFTLAPPDMSVALSTAYARDAASDLWIPSVFKERYEGKPNGEHEVVTCTATYSNFRRFEVLERIK